MDTFSTILNKNNKFLKLVSVPGELILVSKNTKSIHDQERFISEMLLLPKVFMMYVANISEQ